MKKKILSLFLLGIVCSIGECVWGATYDNPTRVTFAEKKFLDVANTEANVTVSSDSYLCYGTLYMANTVTGDKFFARMSGTGGTTSSSYTYSTPATGFLAANSTSATNTYGSVNANSDRPWGLYFTGAVSVSVLKKDNNTSDSKWVILKLYSVSSNGTETLVETKNESSPDKNNIKVLSCDTKLSASTYYKLEINSGNTGNCAIYQVSFKKAPAVDETAPVLESTTPTNGATEVATSGNIVLTFDENVALASGYEFTLTNGISAVKTWNATGTQAVVDNKTITLAYSGLDAATTYTLNINNANKITDTQATPNAMSSISLPSFTTADPRTALTLSFTATETTLEAGGATQATSFSWTEDSGAGSKAYMSSDPTIATVSSEGVVTPLKAGSVTITATGTPTDLVTYKTTSTTLDFTVKAPATKWDFTTINDSYDAYNIYADAGWTETINSGNYRYTSPAAFSSDATANGKTLRAFEDLRTNITIRFDRDEAVNGQSKGRLQITDQLTLKNMQKGQRVTIIYASANGSNARTISTTDLENMSGFSAVTSGSSATGIGYVKANGDVVLEMVPGDGATGNVVNITKIIVEDPVSITLSHTYETYVTTKALDFSDVDGLTAYVATGADASTVTIESVETVPANTPLVLKGEGAHSVPVAVSASAPATNYLVAGTGAAINSENQYVLSIQSGNYVFAPTDDDPATVPVGKAYLDLSGALAAPGLLRIVEADQNATNIENLDSKEDVVKFIENGQILIKKNGIVYDTMGRIVR